MNPSDPARAARAAARERRALRQRYRAFRRSLSRASQLDHSIRIARHFFAAGLVWRAQTIGLYMANDGEVDLRPLAKRLHAAGKQLALPVVRRTKDGAPTLEFFSWEAGSQLLPNRYGILEPSPGATFIPALSIDLLLTPLVAFDQQGTRLGMGAGYYDRFLGPLPAGLRPMVVGVAHEAQRSPVDLPKAAWDEPLDGALTETGWQVFRN